VTPLGASERRRPRSPSVLALGGAALIVAGTFLPVNGGGDFGYRYAIFDRSLEQPSLLLVAVEPLAVAACVAGCALLLWGRASILVAGLLIAFGVQTLAFFVAYVSAALFGDPNYDSFEPGGVVGAIGAALVLAAGVVVGTMRRTSPDVNAL
jgi:hypothetical protein